MGVFAPVVGIIGTLQAAEALKLLTTTGSSMSGQLLLLNCLEMDIRTIGLPRDPACSVCAERS
jgi:adenylyltransferase/sulfurtransferase